MQRVNECLDAFQRKKWLDRDMIKILRRIRGLTRGYCSQDNHIMIFSRGLFITTNENIDTFVSNHSTWGEIYWTVGKNESGSCDFFGWSIDGIFYGYMNELPIIGNAKYVCGCIKVTEIADMSWQQLLFGISQLGLIMSKELIGRAFLEITEMGAMTDNTTERVVLKSPIVDLEINVRSAKLMNVSIPQEIPVNNIHNIEYFLTEGVVYSITSYMQLYDLINIFLKMIKI